MSIKRSFPSAILAVALGLPFAAMAQSRGPGLPSNSRGVFGSLPSAGDVNGGFDVERSPPRTKALLVRDQKHERIRMCSSDPRAFDCNRSVEAVLLRTLVYGRN